MKLLKMVSVASIAIMFTACNQSSDSEQLVLTSEVDTASYIIGANIGKNLKRGVEAGQLDSISVEVLSRAIKDEFTGADPVFGDEQMQEIMMRIAQKNQEKQLEKQRQQFLPNIEEGKNFLAENAKKEGIVTTESGLQYEVIKLGKGAKPTADDQVTAHYHGTLIDGTVFDSSVERGEPLTIPLNRVIPGWTEGIQLMPVGSKFKFYVPYELGYGDRPSGKIEPYSTLIFEVELIGIN